MATDKGQIFIHNIKKKNLATKIPVEPCKASYSCVKWRKKTSSTKADNVFIATRSDGIIEGYHYNTKKRVFSISENFEGDVQINNFDYSPDCSKIAVVGANPAIRLYDLETKKLSHLLDGKGSLIPGHTNRVFSVKLLKDNNTLISSGWDQRIIWWDLRTEQPIESLFGSQIYGDSLDICEGLLLCCNHRDIAQVQL